MNLSPLPPSLSKGRGRFERGASTPLKHHVFCLEESQREAEPLLPKIFPPLSFGRRGGIKGVRLIKKRMDISLIP